jgi:outer membrane biosynthesis protein TonB
MVQIHPYPRPLCHGALYPYLCISLSRGFDEIHWQRKHDRGDLFAGKVGIDRDRQRNEQRGDHSKSRSNWNGQAHVRSLQTTAARTQRIIHQPFQKPPPVRKPPPPRPIPPPKPPPMPPMPPRPPPHTVPRPKPPEPKVGSVRCGR